LDGALVGLRNYNKINWKTLLEFFFLFGNIEIFGYSLYLTVLNLPGDTYEFKTKEREVTIGYSLIGQIY